MYKFIKKGIDDYELQIGKETYNFKRTNETAKILQDVNRRTNIGLMKYLAQNGLTKKDFILEKTDGKGHTKIDETNYLELKKDFQNDVMMEILNELVEKDFKMNLIELFNKMGIDLNKNDQKDQDEITKFTEEYLLIITGKDKSNNTPSPSKK